MRQKFKRSGRFYVYILKCHDKTYYTDYTPNLKRRVKLHNEGKAAKYTRDRRPIKLVWFKEYQRFKPAFKLEKRIKRFTRMQKEELVGGKRLDRLFVTAKCYRVYIKTFGWPLAEL